ncbi:unnamed protein product [Phytomonas sp. EM1]|nr:unnamed protein product [Phytomonas sp. EM1]|eukprot:CCW61580.1 unnamed protein product [Phytomonas sp. isolate EM1]
MLGVSQFEGSIDMDCLSEAFRRAQMANRIFPIAVDFSSDIPKKEVLDNYLPYIQALIRSRREACLEVSSTFFMHEETEPDSVLSYAGDAVAIAIPLTEYISAHQPEE